MPHLRIRKTSILLGVLVFLLQVPCRVNAGSLPQLPTDPEALRLLRKAESLLTDHKTSDAYSTVKSSLVRERSKAAYAVAIEAMLYMDSRKAARDAFTLSRVDDLSDEQVRLIATAFSWAGEHENAIEQLGELTSRHAFKSGKDDFIYGMALYHGGRYRLAKERLQSAIKYEKKQERVNSDPWMWLAYTYLALKKEGDAIRTYEDGLKVLPRNKKLLNAVAWYKATSPVAAYRDNDEALFYAIKLNKIHGETPNNLDTLAAAYAEDGLFDKAIDAQRRAVTEQFPEYRRASLTAALDNKSMSAKEIGSEYLTQVMKADAGKSNQFLGMVERYRLYKSRKPYREPAKR